MAKVNITSPVGRIVMGSLYDASTTDAEGKPLVVKSGPNAGQPRVNYFFALAIPKGAEPHWAHTPWGQQIWNVGNQAFPQAAQAADFSWKIIDGDSQQPGKLFKGKPGKKPCENEGWPGHWVLKFSGGFAPKVYQQEGAGYVQVMQKSFCKPGYFVEVAFSVDGNGSQTQPGVYLNHSMICFRAYGQEISFGPDVASAGFGQSALPAGASMTPPAGAIPMPGNVPPVYPSAPMPSVPPLPTGVPHIPGAAPQIGAPAPIPVMPNTGFVQVPPPAPAPMAPPPAPVAPVRQMTATAPMAPPPAPVAPVRQMTATAQGVTYEAYVAAGWSDAQLVQNGLMLA